MNNKIKVVIIDDDSVFTLLLRTLLSDIPEIGEVYVFNDSVTGLEKLKQLIPDILFLDITMPKLSGLDILSFIQSYKLHIHIIIITGYDEKILDASKYNIISYIIKPINKPELLKVIKTYNEHKEIHTHKFKDSNNHISFKIHISSSFEDLFFSPGEIIYFEADGAYTKIYLETNKTLTSSYHLKKIQEHLPSDVFYRISRKHIINFSYLSKIDKKNKKCVLKHQEEFKTLPYSKDEIFKSGLLQQ